MSNAVRPRDRRLSADDWVGAALAAIADGGLAAVAVEPLAKALGVTKGSFYAHFRNRDQLVEAALLAWEHSHGVDGLAPFAAIPDPAERLRAMLVNALEFTRGVAPSIHVSLLGELRDDRVRAAVHRVGETRLNMLAAAYEELGLSPSRARARARIGYATYTGMLFLAREAPDARLADDALASLQAEADDRLLRDLEAGRH